MFSLCFSGMIQELGWCLEILSIVVICYFPLDPAWLCFAFIDLNISSYSVDTVYVH